MKNHVIICSLSLLLGSCVSVQLTGGKVTPATGVEYKAPPSPFKEIKGINADKSWLSDKTGNTISFLSECNNSNEPNLQQIESDALSAISDLSTRVEDVNYNARAARSSISQGKLDGVPVKIALTVFKKNGCSYTLSYGGIEKKFSTEENFFNQFKESFKAP